MALSMRLDKYLSHMGFGTRNDVKKLIKNGWVTINDETIKKADYNVKEDDKVFVDDEPVSYVEFEYYILNKPQGYVSATEDMVYPTVMELIQSQRHDLYPVGRLDVDTEGLLLISNDGKLTHEVLSPKKHVDKKYYVEFVSIPWWRSHPIHENRTTESIWTEPCNPLLRATKSTKRATSIYEITLIFYLIFE